MNKGRNDHTFLFVLDSNHSRFQYIFMRQKSCLDLSRLDAEAAALDLAIETPEKTVASVGSFRDVIAGAVIANAIEEYEVALGLIGTIPVATHQRIAASQQFSVAFIDPHLGIGTGMADGQRL